MNAIDALSPAQRCALAMLEAYGYPAALDRIREVLDSLSVVDLAAHLEDWEAWWARPKQLPPPGKWKTWGFLTGRGFGKTKCVSTWINQEVEAGRAMLICLVAQDEDSSIDIQINGPSGLIATAPQRNKPEWHVTERQLVWPNGAKAYVRTPNEPGDIRGLEYHLAWISELQSWPKNTREEAYMNVWLSTRLGYARLVWDSTPKKKHPILTKLLKEGDRDPKRHVVVRGTTHENAANLSEDYVADLEAAYAGTSRGREELLGEMLDESEAALFKQSWIDARRRPLPATFARRVIGVDPAVTTRAGNDLTGVVDVALGHDGQAYVVADHTGRHAPAEWAQLVAERYVEGRCDCVVIETNKGHDLVTQNLRAHATSVGLQVVVLGREERPPGHLAGTIHVKEVFARGEKADRAQPLATAYERGRVSHVEGADLVELEEVMTTWEPVAGQRSPDRLDALVHAVGEILSLGSDVVDRKRGFVGITEAAKVLVTPARPPMPGGLAALFGRPGSGRI